MVLQYLPRAREQLLLIPSKTILSWRNCAEMTSERAVSRPSGLRGIESRATDAAHALEIPRNVAGYLEDCPIQSAIGPFVIAAIMDGQRYFVSS